MNMAIYSYLANGGNLYLVCCDDFCFTDFQTGSQLAITIVLPMGKPYGRQIVYTYFRTAVAFLTSKSKIQCRFTMEMECTLF